MIDFHTHIYPDRIAAATVKKLSADGRFFADLNGTKDALKDSMARRNINLSVILPVATNPLTSKVQHLNEFAAQFDGSDGLLSFGGIHPDCPDMKQELKRIKSLGLKGIKLHPAYQGAALDDIRNIRICEEAASLGLIVISHMGYDVGLPGVKLCTPQMAANVVKEVGQFKFVLAHMGGWKDWDNVIKYIPGTGCYIDTSFSLGSVKINTEAPVKENTPDYMRGETMELLSTDEFRRVVDAVGVDHVLFGTDSPWDDPLREAEIIRNSGLSEDELKLIFDENAKGLLGL